ncbi:MAG TPA: dihydropteroate synthase [Spirochaetota bacterium]|nr:dihydropteroate synthase [Spirochaetota bacterium]HOL56233.1 dihydropteroate synthase [Spirochaetota bacterium]HPP04140.1 dihydropteroate synthase [Spirochaetota bacterium]
MKFSFKNRILDFNNDIFIMGVINITPDSFSDGGEYNTLDKALVKVEEMIKEGATIIDIGGESTRPFSEAISEDEEIDRVIPLIEKINRNFETIISIDTYKSKVAELAIQNGAEIINDISGFTFDSNMINVAKKYNATSIIMHIKGTPKDMQINPVYHDVVSEIYDFFKERINFCKNNGVEKLILDPGFGFGKSLDHNYILLKNLNKFTDFGYPVLVGISRKSMIGKVIDVPPKERVAGTISLNTIAILNGAKMVRVHDVKEAYQSIAVIKKYLEI